MRPRQFRKQLGERQAALGASLANLMQAPAAETLHELRFDLHRLRTLLRPLAGRKAFAPLHRQTGRALAATASLHELEVLVDDLEHHRHTRAALARRRQFQHELQAALASRPLRLLETFCRPLPDAAPVVALPDHDALDKRCRKTVERDVARLRRRLEDRRIDPQRLRLDIKRLRYQLEEQELPGLEKELKLLARTQDLLGDWQDRTLWLARAASEADLQPCIERWQAEQAALAQRLPELIGRLRVLLGVAA